MRANTLYELLWPFTEQHYQNVAILLFDRAEQLLQQRVPHQNKILVVVANDKGKLL
jgi:hypothetical protein